MIRVAALLCACSLALAACYGGPRAAIVRSAKPVAPVCLDGRGADAPAWRRICPVTASAASAQRKRAVVQRVGAARLRLSVVSPSSDHRRAGHADETTREAYIDDLIRRRSAAIAEARSGASRLMVPASASAHAVPASPLLRELRGSLD